MQGEVRSTGEVHEDVVQANAFLTSFFQGICAPGPAEHPHLLNSLAMCLGDYAAWFGRYQPHHPLRSRRIQLQPVTLATTQNAGKLVFWCWQHPILVHHPTG